MADEPKKPAIKLVTGDQVREISYEELALSVHMSQEALVKVLIEKKIISPEEFLKALREVKKERYRTE
ncbi:MAG: hypothetical protein L0196_11150 [candidate division Zixibacteria bacterium]|nr:hypothetical protein [candidate division Zixibacteria bacterium]